MQKAERVVISLGGGAVEQTGVRNLLQCDPGALVIFLQAPLTLLIERCLAQDNGSTRPVLKNHEQLQTRYDSRLIYYQKAHLTVETERLTPENVASAIVDRLTALHDANHPNLDPFRDHLG